jgi:hypothetical protein
VIDGSWASIQFKQPVRWLAEQGHRGDMVSQSGRYWAGDPGWRDEADRYALRGDVIDLGRSNEAPCLYGVFALGLAASAPPWTERRR